MLKSIDPLLSPELLYVLAAMGHGDRLVIADANFPAASVAAGTTTGKPLQVAADAPALMRAVLSLMPLDTFEPDPAVGMQVVGAADAVPEVVAEMSALVAAEGAAWASIDRFAFYERARTAFAVVQTAERRFYGNAILVKGVVPPE